MIIVAAATSPRGVALNSMQRKMGQFSPPSAEPSFWLPSCHSSELQHGCNPSSFWDFGGLFIFLLYLLSSADCSLDGWGGL